MRTADKVKLALTICAGILLFWGIRTNVDLYRYVAIGCLAIAVLIRFIAPRRPLN